MGAPVLQAQVGAQEQAQPTTTIHLLPMLRALAGGVPQVEVATRAATAGRAGGGEWPHGARRPASLPVDTRFALRPAHCLSRVCALHSLLTAGTRSTLVTTVSVATQACVWQLRQERIKHADRQGQPPARAARPGRGRAQQAAHLSPGEAQQGGNHQGEERLPGVSRSSLCPRPRWPPLRRAPRCSGAATERPPPRPPPPALLPRSRSMPIPNPPRSATRSWRSSWTKRRSSTRRPCS